MKKSLEEVLKDYDELRQQYSDFIKVGDLNKESLIEFEERFVNVKADLRPHRSKVSSAYTKRDEKASTAIKYRLALAIHNGHHKDFGSCSMNQAEKFAAASIEYKTFLDQRAFYKESLVNLTDLKDDIVSYINLIKDRLNK